MHVLPASCFHGRSPEDKGILKELHALRVTLKAERQAQAQLFKGQFGASPSAPAAPEQLSSSVLEAAGTSGTGVGKGSPTGALPPPLALRGNNRGLVGFLWAYALGLLAWVARCLRLAPAHAHRQQH